MVTDQLDDLTLGEAISLAYEVLQAAAKKASDRRWANTELKLTLAQSYVREAMLLNNIADPWH
jgi:hypothetical protein